MSAPAPEPPAASLLHRLPWLLDANAWRLDWRQPLLAPHESGVWPIGNGRVFAHAGLVLPFNRLQSITGPTYQTEGDHRVAGAFGDCWIELLQDRAPVPFRWHRIWRPRRAGVLVTQAGGGPIVLTTIDFVPPEHATIVRLVELWSREAMEVTVGLHFPAGTPAGPDAALLATHRPAQVAVLHTATPGAKAGPGHIAIPLRLTSGVSRFAATIATAGSEGEAARTARQHGSTAEDLTERTRSHWSRWLARLRVPDEAGTAVLPSCHPPALADLIESAALALKMQQAAAGGVSPMVHFKGTWARDNNGAVRLFLALGALDDAAKLLRYYHDAALLLGEVPNRAPLDLDTSLARAPHDWDRLAVPPAEVPSWLVLQHYWWVGAGGDPDLCRRHWPLLARCIRGQRVSAGGLLPFHGDETYLHGALFATAPGRCPPPNDLIRHRPGDAGPPFSLEATAAYAAACQALASLADRSGATDGVAYARAAAHTRTALERAFWLDRSGHYAPACYTDGPHSVPVAPVNLSLLWMGYSEPDDARARADLAAVVRSCAWRGATPRCAFDVGMTAGYLLWDLVAVRSPLADRAADEVLRRASPAGEWAEIYGPEGRLDAGYDPAHPNRLRPWEGGINAEAILQYLRARATSSDRGRL